MGAACDRRCPESKRQGGTAVQDVFGGERNAIADALNLNAGVALHAAGVASSPQEGVARAQEAQRRGDPEVKVIPISK